MDYDSASGGTGGFGQIFDSSPNALHLGKNSLNPFSAIAQVGTRSLDLRGAAATSNPFTAELSNTDSLALGTALQGDGTAGYAVSLWIKPNSGRTADYATIFALNPGIDIRLRLDNSLFITVHDGSGTTSSVNSTNTTAIANEAWSHILTTMEPTGNNKFTARTYVNGALYSAKTGITGYRTYNAGTSKLQVGRGITSSYFPGQLDDFRFYKRALTSVEAAELANKAVYSPSHVAATPVLPVQITVRKGSDLTLYPGVTLSVYGQTVQTYQADASGKIAASLSYGSHPYTLTKDGESSSGTLLVNTFNQAAELYLGQLPDYPVAFRVTAGGVPLAGASVTLAGVTQSTYENGEAAFPAVVYGTHPYTISKTGYDSVSSTLFVSGSATVQAALNRSVDPTAATAKVTANYGLLQENGPARPAFNIYLNKAMTSDIQVKYAMTGTAVSGTDYVPLPGAVTIPAGQTSALIQVEPVNDATEEWMKRITLQLLADDSEVIRYLPAAGKLAAADVWLEDDETPAPGSLGTNLSSFNYYAAQIAFVDLMNSSSGFSPNVNQNVSFTLDNDGNLLTLASGQKATTIIISSNGGGYPPGIYTFLYEGSATFTFRRDAVKLSEQPGRMQVEVNPTTSGIYLEVTNVDASNPPRNLRFISPGFAELYETEIWQPALLEFFQPFQAIRAMDLMSTNGNPSVTWDKRTTPQSFTQARTGIFTEGGTSYDKPYGVSVEYLTALANRAGRDLWVTLPHMADDNYVEQFAAYIRDHLNPGLKVYVEYSNEVWNGSFIQNAYAKRLGLAEGYPAAESGHFFYANRSVEIFQIFQSVFGEQAGRLVRVLATQSASPNASEIILNAPIPGGTRAYEHADVFSVAPYFGSSVNNDAAFVGQLKTSSTPSEDIYNRVLNTELPNSLYEQIRDNVVIARKYGLQLVAYEGGQHLVASGTYANDTAVIELLGQANRDPGMEQVYEAYLNLWKQEGGSLFMNFSSIAASGKYGSWGALETMYEDGATVPKYKALRTFMDDNPVWWNSTVEPLPPVKSMEAKQLASNIVLNNRLDEPAWEMTAIDRKYVNQTDSNNEAEFGVLWDADNLYIGVRVKDSVLVADSASVYDDDSVEIFIDGDLSKSRGWGSQDYRLVKRYNEGVWDSEGFTLEFAVPWSTLGIQPEDGVTVGFDVNAYDDDNGGGRDAILGWEGVKFNYVTTAYMGELVLSEEAVQDDSLSAVVPAAVTAGTDWSAAITMNPRNPVEGAAFTVEYDETKLEFVSAQAAHPSAVLDSVNGATPGEVAVDVSFSTPVQEATTVISLTFRAKAAVSPSVTQLTVRDGTFVGTEGTFAAYGGTWPITVELDGSALSDLLAEAQLLHDTSITGTDPGQYPLEAKLRLAAAIAVAQGVYENAESGLYKLAVAHDMLQHEMERFGGAVTGAE
jgi:hypothetical protein